MLRNRAEGGFGSSMAPRSPKARVRGLVPALVVVLVTATACTVTTPSDSGGEARVSPTDVTLTDVAARAAHTATTLADGRIFVAGGCVIDGCGQASDTTFLLLADGRSAVSGPRLSGPRDGHTATLVDAGVVLAGGFSGEGQGALGSVELFDPATDTIRSLNALAQARGGQAAAALPDGRVLIVGGWIASHTYTSSAEIVDPATGAVTRTADAPVAGDALDAVPLADGRVLVTGGQVQPAVGTAEAEIYDPGRDAWTTLPRMSTPRLKHLSVLLSDGRVLIIGGTSDDEHLLATTEVFDPRTDTFTDGPSLLEGRYKMTGGAVSLPGNRVLIGGGGTSVELLDVGEGTSRIVERLGNRASFATMNAWGADEFIVLGGYDDRISLRREYLIVSVRDLATS
jgi:Kelch motif/Galactose oxidase, central domain